MGRLTADELSALAEANIRLHALVKLVEQLKEVAEDVRDEVFIIGRRLVEPEGGQYGKDGSD